MVVFLEQILVALAGGEGGLVLEFGVVESIAVLLNDFLDEISLVGFDKRDRDAFFGCFEDETLYGFVYVF